MELHTGEFTKIIYIFTESLTYFSLSLGRVLHIDHSHNYR